jgi:hypothetical protein
VKEYALLECWTRVSLEDYASNIRAMMALAKARAAGVTRLSNRMEQSDGMMREDVSVQRCLDAIR